VSTPNLKTTLLLIPGGREISLPENASAFKKALEHAAINKTAVIIMLSDEVLIPENIVQSRYKFKNILLLESDAIETEQDVWNVVGTTLNGHLPVLSTSGFDYQVVNMEHIQVKYEDFERLEKFM
jgi:hypothetical protein